MDTSQYLESENNTNRWSRNDRKRKHLVCFFLVEHAFLCPAFIAHSSQITRIQLPQNTLTVGFQSTLLYVPFCCRRRHPDNPVWGNNKTQDCKKCGATHGAFSPKTLLEQLKCANITCLGITCFVPLHKLAAHVCQINAKVFLTQVSPYYRHISKENT